MPGAYTYGWDYDNDCWRKIRVNDQGKLVIDPSELFEEPPTDGETGKGATSNWCHDHEADAAAHHAKYTDAEAVASFGNRSEFLTPGVYIDHDVSDISIILFDTRLGDIELKGLLGGITNQIIFCVKVWTDNEVIIHHENAISAAVNRIKTTSDTDETIPVGVSGGFRLLYTMSRWRVDHDIGLCRKVIFEDTPTDNELLKGPTSNWAHDHKADAAAHHAKYTDAEAVAAWGNRSVELTAGEYTDYDVSNYNVIFLNTTGGDITLKGLIAGITNQVLFIVKRYQLNDVIVHNNSLDANIDRRFLTVTAANETILDTRRGGFRCVRGDGYWLVDRELT